MLTLHLMKKILLIAALFACKAASAQLIMTVEMREPVEGICDNEAVYGLYNGFTGQVEPECSATNEEIQQALNEIPFLKANPKFKSKKGMIGFYVSCKGEMLECKMSVSTGNEELDKQLETVFGRFNDWQPGTLDGKEVDTRELVSFVVKGGKIILNQ
jgi:hypothetical protein